MEVTTTVNPGTCKVLDIIIMIQFVNAMTTVLYIQLYFLNSPKNHTIIDFEND